MPELSSFLRSLRNMTLKEASERSGIDPSRISDFERGARAPNPSHLVRLAQAYGVDRVLLLLYADFWELPGFDALLRAVQEEDGLNQVLQEASLQEKRQLAQHLASLRMVVEQEVI